MNRIQNFVLAALGMSLALCAPASAQSTFADKALITITGKWVNGQGRLIEFRIKNSNAGFEDEVESGITLTGSYRQDDSGAGYVLKYERGYLCRYNISVLSGADGNELVLRLVSSDGPDSGGRFKCISGTLKRAN